MTIDAIDALGNPLVQSSGSALSISLRPSGPFGTSGIESANFISESGDTAPAVLSPGNSTVGGNPATVPEPSALLLALLAVLGAATIRFAPHHSRCQTG